MTARVFLPWVEVRKYERRECPKSRVGFQQVEMVMHILSRGSHVAKGGGETWGQIWSTWNGPCVQGGVGGNPGRAVTGLLPPTELLDLLLRAGPGAGAFRDRSSRAWLRRVGCCQWKTDGMCSKALGRWSESKQTQAMFSPNTTARGWGSSLQVSMKLTVRGELSTHDSPRREGMSLPPDVSVSGQTHCHP